MTMFARAVSGAAFLVVLAASTSGAIAQDCTSSDTLNDLAACYNKLLNRADADMQAKYQEVEAPVKHLSMIDQAMAKSQEDWVAYRDQTCDNLVRLHFLEGQFERVSVINCKLALTRERTSDLQNVFVPLFGAGK